MAHGGGGEQEPCAPVTWSRPARCARQDGVSRTLIALLVGLLVLIRVLISLFELFPVIFKVVRVTHSWFKVFAFQVGHKVAVFRDVCLRSSPYSYDFLWVTARKQDQFYSTEDTWSDERSVCLPGVVSSPFSGCYFTTCFVRLVLLSFMSQ